MSNNKIKNYLKAIKAGIQNGDKIIEAMWIATQVKNNEVSEEALAEIMFRKDQCATCPFNSKNAAENGQATLGLPFQHCIHCACRIGGNDTKEFCLTCNCGLTEWNKKHPNAFIPLRWSEFKQPTTNNVT